MRRLPAHPVPTREEDRPAASLRLGDTIVYAPLTDEPVSWLLAADPTTCPCGHVEILVNVAPGDQRVLVTHRDRFLAVEVAEAGTAVA